MPSLAESNILDVIKAPKTYFVNSQIKPPPIAIWCRVSTRQQERNGNLAAQEVGMLEWAERKKFYVTGVFSDVRNGRYLEGSDSWDKAVCFARENRYPLLAWSLDRFIRVEGYSGYESDALYGKREIQLLQALEVVLMTRLHPDTPMSVVRSEMTRNGQRSKERKGGRPPTQGKRWKLTDADKRKIVRLRKQHLSHGQIAEAMERPRSTVSEFLRRRKLAD